MREGFEGTSLFRVDGSFRRWAMVSLNFVDFFKIWDPEAFLDFLAIFGPYDPK